MATPDLVIPPQIEAVIQDYDRAKDPFAEFAVQQALVEARKTIQDPAEPERFGAWAEILAFALVETRREGSPWNTYFGPIGSGTDKEGKVFYSPDIAGADAQVIGHWSRRAKELTNPILKARYADLAWDMSLAIANERRDPEMARIAIDSYLASLSQNLRKERHERFDAALRAFDLAIMLRDTERTNRSRAALLELHQEVVSEYGAEWWLAYDRLITEKNGGVTDSERQQLIANLEKLILHFSNISDASAFNPHATQSAAQRLIRHYTRTGNSDNAKRLHATVARVFEHFGSLGNPMLASAALQTAVNAYHDAGQHDESKRVRILMEGKISEARNQMKAVGTEIKIARDDIDTFLEQTVVDDLASTFVRIAVQFLPNRGELEKQVQDLLIHAPMSSRISQAIMADDHVAARVGSVEDDPYGRLIQQTSLNFGFSAIWLDWALGGAIGKHTLTAEHFVGWANRLELFEDLTFLIEGVRAWLDGDFVKAVHVLVPQVERGLRGIIAALNLPVTKAHTKIADVGVAIGLGDILYSEPIVEALGPDLTLYFLTLYADPRGKNLRNRVAHGLIKPDVIGLALVQLLIHTLLVFGVWKELAESRR